MGGVTEPRDGMQPFVAGATKGCSQMSPLNGNQKLGKTACYLETRMTVYGFAESAGPKAFTK
jgi:hypothetical protein